MVGNNFLDNKCICQQRLTQGYIKDNGNYIGIYSMVSFVVLWLSLGECCTLELVYWYTMGGKVIVEFGENHLLSCYWWTWND